MMIIYPLLLIVILVSYYWVSFYIIILNKNIYILLYYIFFLPYSFSFFYFLLFFFFFSSSSSSFFSFSFSFLLWRHLLVESSRLAWHGLFALYLRRQYAAAILLLAALFLSCYVVLAQTSSEHYIQCSPNLVPNKASGAL